MEAESNAVVRIDRDADVLRLTLDRPQVRNALNHEIVEILTREIAAAANDPGIRVIVLAAAGKVFSAGVDLARLRGLASVSRAENVADATTHCVMLRTVFTCPKPVIAAVHGSVHGGAVGLICACDVVVAADSARFATAEARVGLAPVLLAPYLAAAIGTRAARYHLLTGEPIEAAQALQLGLVHRLVPEADLPEAVSAVVGAIRRGGPAALGVTKRVLAEAVTLPLEAPAMRHAAELIATARAGAEAREGVGAFLDKRVPVWPPLEVPA